MFKDKPLSQRKTLIKAMVKRMAEAYEVELKHLPEASGCQRNVINNWSYYGRIPFEHLFRCHELTGVSMDFLLHGKKPPISLTETQVKALRKLTLDLLEDGIDFGLIQQRREGAVKQMGIKYTKDLTLWLKSLDGDIGPQ